MRRITFPLTLAIALVAAGCHSYKPLPHPASAIGKTVKVEFAVPRNLVAVRGAGGDSVLSTVSALRGRVVNAVGDTMHVVLLRVTDTAREHQVPPGMTITVVPDPSVAIDVLEIDEGKTAAFAGGTIYVVSMLLVATVLVALATVSSN